MQRKPTITQMNKAEAVRTRTSSTVPFGWELHPENESLLVENDAEQDALSYIKSISAGASLRTMTSMIKARTGRHITPRGMQKILAREY